MSESFGSIVSHTIGGGWGTDIPADGDIAVRIIRGADFPQAELRDASSFPVRFEPAKKVVSRALRMGDIVLETSGGTSDRPTGRSIFVTDSLVAASEEPLIPASFCRLIRVNPVKANAAFVYYALQDLYRRGGTWEFQNTSTGISNFQYELFQRAFSLPGHQIPAQQAIAEVLGALDDKIAANTRLAATIDELLGLEFRRVLRQATIEEVPLRSVAEIVLGGTPSRAEARYWTAGTTPWLNSGAANASRIIEPSELITEEALARSAAKLMPRGTTLIAITGATLGQIARLEIESAGNQSLVGVSSADAALNDWLYFAIQERRDELLTRATGAAQQHVSKGDVAELMVPVPSDEDRRSFRETASPLLQSAAGTLFENRTLAATRNAILPQLMSGKLRVRQAEAAASAAGA